MGQIVALTAEDGHKLSAYRANPTGKPRGGLVIVQEIFGVNFHIKKVCDGFAADGYVALAPALFDRVERDVAVGYSPADIERGRELRGKVGWDQMVVDVRAAVHALQGEKLKVGVIGYCMGGSLTWLAAARIEGVAAGGSGYGRALPPIPRARARSPGAVP